MNAKPSATTIAATTDVLKLASLLDHRVGNPDKARILAWANQIKRHNLTRDDMLDAVQEFYDRPTAQPLCIGDLVEGARRLKNDRLARDPDDAGVSARRDQLDQAIEAVEDAAEHAAILDGMAAVPRGVNPLLVRCPHRPCNAPVFAHCRAPGGLGSRRRVGAMRFFRAHPCRIEKATAEAEADTPEACTRAAEAARAEQARALAKWRADQRAQTARNGAA